MLVKNEHIFFHIDFGHLWNQSPLLDGPRMAIPMRLKNNLTIVCYVVLVYYDSIRVIIINRKNGRNLKRFV